MTSSSTCHLELAALDGNPVTFCLSCLVFYYVYSVYVVLIDFCYFYGLLTAMLVRTEHNPVCLFPVVKPHGTKGHHAPMQYSRQARLRPYADPYSETCDDDDTIVSHWSIDERVKKLLYDDDEVRQVTTSVFTV